jgi:hypothetical protein
MTLRFHYNNRSQLAFILNKMEELDLYKIYPDLYEEIRTKFHMNLSTDNSDIFEKMYKLGDPRLITLTFF